MPKLPLRAEQTDFRGWNAYELANEFVRLVAVPDIGGRIMAYDLGPHPFFFVDPDLAGKLFTPAENQGDGSLAAWKNYGGDKTWPAPQGWQSDAEWHGPPDPVLDTGRYHLDELRSDEREATLCLVSPPDTRTGVQITRRFTVGRATSRVRVDLTFHNVVDRPIRWGIWDVVQLRAEQVQADGSRAYDPSCAVTVPLNPHSCFPGGYAVMFGADDNPQWQVDGALLRAGYLWQIGKVGIDSPAGWIAFSQGSQGVAFVERFAVEADAEYPDNGATVECWTIGAGQVANLDYANSGIYLMETEVLGPMRTIAPDGVTTFGIEWASCRCAGPVVDVQAGGCAVQRLSALRSDGIVHLVGSFGTFDAGELEVIWRDARGQSLTCESMGRVDPFTAIVVDRLANAPATATAVELQITAADDGLARRLAAVAIERA